jgi:hydroxymethylbilane synthase
LLQRQIDLAVHSLKDLPTEPVEGLLLAAVPQRGPHGDVLVCAGDFTMETLPQGAKLGTGSVRRRAQLLHFRADLCVEPVRGNVDTRLRKLDSGHFQAIVLAEAGVQRLELAQRITQRLPMEIMLPAVGQGALALETRADDRATQQAVAPLDDMETHAAVRAERAMLAALRGGCLAPVAGWGRLEGGKLVLTGRVLSPDGSRRIETTESADPQQPEALGRLVADILLARGAREMIAAARQ